MPVFLSSTGIATHEVISLSFNLPKSFSSLIRYLSAVSTVICDEVKASPARPRLLFILIESMANWPAFCYCDRDKLYKWSISLLCKNNTTLSKLSLPIWNLPLSFKHTSNQRCHFRNHRNHQSIVTLIHEAFVVLEFIIELLLDVVLHLMWDQTTCNLFANLGHQSKVIRCEVLIAFFICHFKASNCVVAELYWNEQHIFDDLM